MPISARSPAFSSGQTASLRRAIFLRAAPFGRIAFANTDLAGAMDHRFSILERQRAVAAAARQVVTVYVPTKLARFHRSSMTYDGLLQIQKPTPSNAGLTTRTTPSASTFWSFRVSVTRTRDFSDKGLLVHTKAATQ